MAVACPCPFLPAPGVLPACAWCPCLLMVREGVAVSNPGQSPGWVHPAASLAHGWERRRKRGKRKKELGSSHAKRVLLPGLMLQVSVGVSSCSTSFTSHGFGFFWAGMRRVGAKSRHAGSRGWGRSPPSHCLQVPALPRLLRAPNTRDEQWGSTQNRAQMFPADHPARSLVKARSNPAQAAQAAWMLGRGVGIRSST